MFSGLMSRWTMPRSWANCSASHNGGTMASASSGVNFRARKSWRRFSAVHKFHEQEIESARLPEVVNRDDVRMVQRASACASRVKRSANFGVAHALRREQFERDEAVQGFLPRLIDHAHAAAPEAFQDFQLRKMRRDLFGRQRRCAAGGVAGEDRFRLQVQRHEAIRAKPGGALSWRGAPHCGHLDDNGLLMPCTYRQPVDCYAKSSSILHSSLAAPKRSDGGSSILARSLPRQRRRQMAQFAFQIGALGQGLRNLLAVDFAEALPQPMHRHARRALVHASCSATAA